MKTIVALFVVNWFIFVIIGLVVSIYRGYISVLPTSLWVINNYLQLDKNIEFLKLKGYKICIKNCLDYCKSAVYDKIKNTLILTTKILRTDTTYIILSYEVIL